MKRPVEADAAGAIGVLLGAGICGVGGWPAALAAAVLYWIYVHWRSAHDNES